MDKFDKHIAKGKELRLKNDSGEEDVFYLEPLAFSHFGTLMEIMVLVLTTR